MSSYRKPTEKESARLDAARKKTQEGIAGEKDIFSKMSTTAAKAARDDVKAGLKMRESVPASAREGEAYEQAGYKKGGKVMKKKMKRFEEGGYTGDDEIVKYRMGMIDAKGNDLTKSKKETVEDNDPYGATKKETSADLDPYNAASKSSTSETPKNAAPKATPKAEPKFTPLTNKDEEGNKLPTDVKKPHIAIPKNAAGMQQYRSDAESPIGKLFRAMTGSKSQRTTAAEKKMKSGGKVKSASARADGCAIRGKTRA